MKVVWLVLVNIIVRATDGVKPKSVNLALETVLRFDKENYDADVGVINKVQNFLDTVKKHVVSNGRRRNTAGNLKLKDFIKESAKILKQCNDTDLEDVFAVLDDEMRKYHYKGCKFYELVENNDVRSYLSTQLERAKGAKASELRAGLEKIIITIENDTLNGKGKTILELLGSLYTGAARGFRNVIDGLQTYKIKGADGMNLTHFLSNALRTLVFDHYSNLNDNARAQVKNALHSYWNLNNDNVHYKSMKDAGKKHRLRTIDVDIFKNKEMHAWSQYIVKNTESTSRPILRDLSGYNVQSKENMEPKLNVMGNNQENKMGVKLKRFKVTGRSEMTEKPTSPTTTIAPVLSTKIIFEDDDYIASESEEKKTQGKDKNKHDILRTKASKEEDELFLNSKEFTKLPVDTDYSRERTNKNDIKIESKSKEKGNEEHIESLKIEFISRNNVRGHDTDRVKTKTTTVATLEIIEREPYNSVKTDRVKVKKNLLPLNSETQVTKYYDQAVNSNVGFSTDEEGSDPKKDIMSTENNLSIEAKAKETIEVDPDAMELLMGGQKIERMNYKSDQLTKKLLRLNEKEDEETVKMESPLRFNENNDEKQKRFETYVRNKEKKDKKNKKIESHLRKKTKKDEESKKVERHLENKDQRDEKLEKIEHYLRKKENKEKQVQKDKKSKKIERHLRSKEQNDKELKKIARHLESKGQKDKKSKKIERHLRQKENTEGESKKIERHLENKEQKEEESKKIKHHLRNKEKGDEKPMKFEHHKHKTKNYRESIATDSLVRYKVNKDKPEQVEKIFAEHSAIINFQLPIVRIEKSVASETTEGVLKKKRHHKSSKKHLRETKKSHKREKTEKSKSEDARKAFENIDNAQGMATNFKKDTLDDIINRKDQFNNSQDNITDSQMKDLFNKLESQLKVVQRQIEEFSQPELNEIDNIAPVTSNIAPATSIITPATSISAPVTSGLLGSFGAPSSPIEETRNMTIPTAEAKLLTKTVVNVVNPVVTTFQTENTITTTTKAKPAPMFRSQNDDILTNNIVLKEIPDTTLLPPGPDPFKNSNVISSKSNIDKLPSADLLGSGVFARDPQGEKSQNIQSRPIAAPAPLMRADAANVPLQNQMATKDLSILRERLRSLLLNNKIQELPPVPDTTLINLKVTSEPVTTDTEMEDMKRQWESLKANMAPFGETVPSTESPTPATEDDGLKALQDLQI